MENADILARLVRLETKICLKFEEVDRALILARELVERQRQEAKEIIDHRLEILNDHQRRMDKLENTFAATDMLHNEVRSITKRQDITDRLVYIGVGIAIALQIFFKFFIRGA